MSKAEGRVPTRPTNNTDAASVPRPGDTSRRRCRSRDYERGFCDGWRDRAEYARRTGLTFDDGCAYGWQAAHRAMRNTIADACQGIPHDAAEIIRQLVRTWDR